MVSISAFLRLTRFEHAIMLAIAVLIGEIIAGGSIPLFSFVILLSLLVPIFSEMGSFALNDYLDVESDRINKRTDRPLVSGEIKPNFALYFSILSIAASVILSYFINIYAFGIALVFNALAIAYNYKLKDLPLAGNVYIGLTMAIPFLFGSVVVRNSADFDPTILSIFAIAFIAGVAREIIKSVEDMEGDKKARKSNTLPILIGEQNARRLASLLYLVFVPLAFAPFYFGLKINIVPLAFVAIADLGVLYLAYIIFTGWSSPVLKKARNLSLLFLFIGLIGLLLAAVI
ncbi:TPA: UbiA family prenyltransferase [Candidatus Micrarchaeota archaeon]|nr:UbiA family prenyltransferase [Candidatus Micrarchaeota archaeon]